jgi:hypothetical protein
LLAQLEVDGSLDTTFGDGGLRLDDVDARLGLGSALRSLALDPSGRAVVAGVRNGSSSPIVSRAGTDFRIVFPASTQPTDDVHLMISADTATSGRITNAAMGIDRPFTVTPGELTVVRLPPTIEIQVNDGVDTKGLHLSAQAPVTVHTLSGRASVSTDGSMLLPTPMLGQHYRLMSWGNGAGASLAVAAAHPDTTLTITPIIASVERPAGVPFQVELQPGQAYQLRAASSGDLSGTTVVADKPVAVFGSNACAFIPEGGTCDHIIEQMLPAESFGREFYSLPSPGRPAGDILRVFAHTDGTRVELDGTEVATLAAGEHFQTLLAQPAQITTSAPASVARYSQACNIDGGNPCLGDPMMLTLLPTDQWVSRYTAAVPLRLFDPTYLYTLLVVAPAAAIGDVRVDGQAISPASFLPIGSSGYAGASVVVAPGMHRVTSPQPISVSVQGSGVAESYAFPAAAAASGGDADADDLVLRYTAAGERDVAFGIGGVVLLDHRSGYDSDLPAFDAAQRAIVDGGEILVGSASTNASSGQSFFVGYRLRAGTIFRNGFEGN